MKTALPLLTALLLAPLASLHAADAPTKRPNVVVILADDLGWGDLSCYPKDSANPDAAMFTPHLDSLAMQGVRFTQATQDHVLSFSGSGPVDRTFSAAVRIR